MQKEDVDVADPLIVFFFKINSSLCCYENGGYKGFTKVSHASQSPSAFSLFSHKKKERDELQREERKNKKRVETFSS